MLLCVQSCVRSVTEEEFLGQSLHPDWEDASAFYWVSVQRSLHPCLAWCVADKYICETQRKLLITFRVLWGKSKVSLLSVLKE